MADKANDEKKKKKGTSLVHKPDMDRATNFAHRLGFKVTGFEFSRDKMAMTVEDCTGAKDTITRRSGDDDDLDKAIEDDNGDD